MAIKSIDDTMFPNGLVPSLLVFVSLPKFRGLRRTNQKQKNMQDPKWKADGKDLLLSHE